MNFRVSGQKINTTTSVQLKVCIYIYIYIYMLCFAPKTVIIHVGINDLLND